MHLEKKKKQHYVWRKYLKKWSEKDSIHCLMGQKVFNTGLMNVGQERYFYKLKELTSSEIKFLKLFINQSDRPLLRQLNHGWIDFFNQVHELRKKLDDHQTSHPELDKYFDVLICNFEEDYHCSIESKGDEFLERLYKHDLSFYSDDEKLISFLNYLCVQYFRTQRIAANISRNLNGFKGLNIEAMWSVLRHVCATNVGLSLYEERSLFSLVILENHTSTPFITGDQPVINIYAIGLQDEEIPEELELYYPLTPQSALLLTKNDKYKAHSVQAISEEDVLFFNKGIYDQSERQVYSACPKLLEMLII